MYNEDGLRVQKTATSTGTTKYTLHGKNIVHLTNGDDELHFFYDAQGRTAVVEYNGVPYRYVHNLQGDVVALVDGNGDKVVEYWYDACMIKGFIVFLALLAFAQPFNALAVEEISSGYREKSTQSEHVDDSVYLFYLMEVIIAVEYDNRMSANDLLQMMEKKHVYYKSLKQQEECLTISFLDCVDLIVQSDSQNSITGMTVAFNCDEHQISWHFPIALDMLENYIAWKQPARAFSFHNSTSSGAWKTCCNAEHSGLSVAANAFFSALQSIVKYQTAEEEERKEILASMENVAGWNETYDVIGKSMERRWFIRSNDGSIIDEDCDIRLTLLLNRNTSEMIGATILMWPPADRDLFEEALVTNFHITKLNTLYHVTVHCGRIEFLGEIEATDLSNR